jgi:hypothetical protein
MKYHDLSKECLKEKLELLYKGIGAWGDWFMNCRTKTETAFPHSTTETKPA